jgi:2,5-diketo-D-gluconate reductase A
MKNAVPALKLKSGGMLPQLGLGTWPMDDAQAAAAVALAIGQGYRLIDTAENYRNEQGVGEGIRAAGVAREELFITTKFNREWHSIAGARQACSNSLQRLGLDYLDLLLIHWPNPQQGRYVEAFAGLQQLQQEGLVRAIGTSNFKPDHLQILLQHGMVPEVNQIQLDPYHPRAELIPLHAQHGIITEAWSPLGRAGELLHDPVVVDIARQHGKSAAQVVLRWVTQSGFVAIPKSADSVRLQQNLSIFEFSLTGEDMQRLDSVGRPDPDMLDADIFGH